MLRKVPMRSTLPCLTSRTPGAGRPGWRALGGAAALALVLAAPGAQALDDLRIGGPPVRRGPTAAERAEAVKAERLATEARAAALATQEEELRKQAAAEAAAEKVRCPDLVQIKYPWVTCVTNEWGGKELVVPGTAPATGVERMLRGRRG